MFCLFGWFWILVCYCCIVLVHALGLGDGGHFERICLGFDWSCFISLCSMRVLVACASCLFVLVYAI